MWWLFEVEAWPRRFERVVNPATVMLLTACLSLFSWADYRIDRLSSGVLSQRQILAMSVTGSAAPAFDSDGAEPLQPAPTVLAFAGPMIPAEILEERNRTETAAPVQIAMASFIDPPETLFIEKLRRRSHPPSSEFSMRLSVDEADEVVAPAHSTRRAVSAEATVALPEIITADAATGIARLSPPAVLATRILLAGKLGGDVVLHGV